MLNFQRNFLVSFLCRKKTFSGPLFSEKAFHKESIILNNNNKTIGNNEELAEIFNKYFGELMENLNTDKTLACNIINSDIAGLVFNTIKEV